MYEELKAAVAALSALMERIKEYEEVAAKLDSVSAKLSATEKAQADIDKKLGDSQAQLTAEQRGAQAQYDASIFEKSQELKTLNDRIESAKAERASEESKLAAAKQQHEEIEASLVNLKKKFA